jgi:hypothetical protein
MNHGVIPTIRKKVTSNLDFSEKDMVLFPNIVDGSEMEYSVTGKGVKEDIIINKKSAVYRYPFILECDNVIAEYQEKEKTALEGASGMLVDSMNIFD